LNADSTGGSLNPSKSGFFVRPVDIATNKTNVLTYNTTSGEIGYTTSLTGIAITGTSITGQTLTMSDSNVKENIMPANLGICYSNVKALPLQRYNFIPFYAESRQDKTQIGFLAQQVSTIFPKSIYDIYDDTLSTSVAHINYDQIFISHYGTTQLLMSTVEGQQTEIHDLTATVSTHTSLINKLLDA